MDQRLGRVRSACKVMGNMAFAMYILLLCMWGQNGKPGVAEFTIAIIASVIFAVKCNIEIVTDKQQYVLSAIEIVICIAGAAISASALL